jgi:transposase
MLIIGCDYHPSWQQISWMDPETGETGERKLVHATGEAEKFYQQLAAPARIGMESTGNCQWFVEMATAAGHEVWIGDAAKIRASDVRQQKHDKRDAALLLQLLRGKRFPRIWTPSSEQRDLRQLLIHRHKLVRLRAQAKNELQHLAMNQGVQKQRRLWSKAGQKLLLELPLKPWASRRRGSWPYDSTGCCARKSSIRRSFRSRAARGCPWSSAARRIDRHIDWALSSRCKSGFAWKNHGRS